MSVPGAMAMVWGDDSPDVWSCRVARDCVADGFVAALSGERVRNMTSEAPSSSDTKLSPAIIGVRLFRFLARCFRSLPGSRSVCCGFSSV
ncbi:hypothetical protein [Rhodopirellula sallentina]|uniref:hypothetical protein n=1 Tax=Rhodopirellula sallentina TaxID=1263869 RepID=UPI001181931B|nr:hypothetical protein [Rhodopirellula sallentina]